MTKWRPYERVRWESTIFSMHLASMPPILISQVQLQRFGAAAAAKTVRRVRARDGCVQKFVRPCSLFFKVSSQCNQASENINMLLNKTSLRKGSSVRIKVAFIMSVYQNTGSAEKNITTLPIQQRKGKKRMGRNGTIFHFDIFSGSFFVCVCLYMFSLTRFSSVQLNYIQLSGLCSPDKIMLSKLKSKHMKILRLISTFLQFIDCITWVNKADSIPR